MLLLRFRLVLGYGVHRLRKALGQVARFRTDGEQAVEDGAGDPGQRSGDGLRCPLMVGSRGVWQGGTVSDPGRVTCVDPRALDRSFVGRTFGGAFLEDRPRRVDPCGEPGQFHTFVWAGPMFSKSIAVAPGVVPA